jgi:Ca-activated chloride channel family protein
MEGPSLEQACAALAAGIRRLGPGERFNVIRFSDEARALFPAPVPADEIHRATALAFVDSLRASGGTNIRAAVELALALPGDAGRLRQVVFATDGSVANEAELVALVKARAGHTRWFTIGIGAAPNAWFLRELAAAGRGSHVLIADPAQVRERVDDLLLKLERPALVGLELHWPPGLTPDLAAPLPRDVYAGDPLVVLARLSGPPAGLLGLSGRTADGAWLRQELLGPPAAGAGIAKLWARERIGEWSRRKQLGLGEADELDARIEGLAMEHHLVSERTSLVAVESTPVRAAGEALKSAQAPTPAPAGSYWARTAGFAATATPAPLAARVALFALALALWLALPLRRRA